MRIRRSFAFSMLVAYSLAISSGCGESTEVKLAPAAPTKADEVKPLPKEPQKGGGKSSSGNMNRNPGGNS